MRPSASWTSSAERSPQPSSSMSAVIAARPGRSPGSADAPAGTSSEHADERHRDGARPSRRAARWRASGGRSSGSGRGARARAPAGGCDRRSSRDRHRPRVERESQTAARDDAEDHALTREEPARGGAAKRFARRAAVALQIALEVPGIAEEHVVGVQLIGLAAETADGLQAEEEVRLRLRQAALQLVRRRTPFDR